MVVHDDLDLPAGQLRVRRARQQRRSPRRRLDRRAASVAEFARVRVGIGRPPDGGDAADYVLAPLSPAELGALRADVERASDAVECLVARRHATRR